MGKRIGINLSFTQDIILLHSQRRNGATQLFFYNRKRKTHQWIHGRCVRANTWNNPCPPLSGITEAERDGNETFSLSQKAKESLLALAWRENEGKANVFVKPEVQRELARFGLARKRR